MGRITLRYLCCLLLIIIFSGGIIKAEQLVKVNGLKMQYLKAKDRLDVFGNAQVITDDVTINADMIQAIFKNGEIIEIKAMGGVSIEKGDETYTGRELTYHLKDENGFILDIEAQAKLEESQEIAYLFGKEATYTDDLIDILDGHFTTCDLDHPHYLFKAKRIKIYPEDKIQAYHVTFWEFNGKIPLFYWPYYSKSLKEKKEKFTPSVGYSAATGWFLKTVYSFYSDESDRHGELYLDYFQKLGLGGGAKYYYLDKEGKQGYAYLYLQQKKTNMTNPYLDFQHFQSYKWNEWFFKTSTALKRYETRDNYSNTTSASYRKGMDSFSWNATYSGANNFLYNTQTHFLQNKVNTRFNLFGINITGNFQDDRHFDRPDSNFWKGNVKLAHRIGFLNWYLLMKKDANSNPNMNFYTLPEVEANLDFGRINNTQLKPFISPFDLILKAGNYIEMRTETNALKLAGNLKFYKIFNLPGPFTLTPKGNGSINLYSTADFNYSYNPSVELKVSQREGFYSSMTYSYQNGDGKSPFAFDRPGTSERQSVQGSIGYTKSGFTVSSNTTYDLMQKRFTIMTNRINYKVNTNTMWVTVPFDIQNRRFNKITAHADLKFTDFKLTLESELEPDGWEFKKLKSDLDWKVNQDWHLKSIIEFDPSRGFDLEDYRTKARIEVIRNLHCREISINYDFVQKEIWVQYNITAFPKEKVRIGSNPEEPILLDLNLGGMTIGR